MKKNKAISSAFRRIAGKQKEYEDAKVNMISVLTGIVEFDFYIEHLAGDGICIGNADTASVAPLQWCIPIIHEKGKLSFKDHLELCI